MCLGMSCSCRDTAAAKAERVRAASVGEDPRLAVELFQISSILPPAL